MLRTDLSNKPMPDPSTQLIIAARQNGAYKEHNLCALLTLKSQENDKTPDLLTELFAPLLTSDSFRRTLESVSRSWTLRFDHVSDSGFALDLEQNTLLLDNAGLVPEALARSVYFKQCMRHNLLKAVRDIHHSERFQKDYDSYTVDSLIQCERVRSADAECFALLCAYEMNMAEDTSRLWQHILCSETGDMAIQFKRFLERSPFSHNVLDLALQQAFKQWFEDKARVAACDHNGLEEIDRQIEWNKEKMRKRRKKLNAAKLSEMTKYTPQKGSYLGDLAIHLLNQPQFSALNDAINQAHFTHILRDLYTTEKGDVCFRSAALADKIFPDTPQKVSEPADLPLR